MLLLLLLPRVLLRHGCSSLPLPPTPPFGLFLVVAVVVVPLPTAWLVLSSREMLTMVSAPDVDDTNDLVVALELALVRWWW